jgi:hypothetical protein
MLHRRIERLEEEKHKADFGIVVIYDPREGVPPVAHQAGNVVYLPDNGREEKSSHVETN